MTWVKIDDSFPNHPKIIGLSDRAFRVHISGLCYCGTYLTDGFIPFAAVEALVKEPEYKPTDELEAVGLWIRTDKGFQIHDYLEHQTSKSQVESKRENAKERVKRFRNKKESVIDIDDWDLIEPSNAVTNALVTQPEYRTQNTEDRRQNTEVITTADSFEEKDSNKEIELSDKNDEPYLAPLPRIKTAQEAVQRVSDLLQNAREKGINAWNLSKLIEDEWDKLHNANDMVGCSALTVWYVSELQMRSLSSAEIARITQMTKRFGRIALLAIDTAASKELRQETDLVNYAFRVAQNLHKEMAGK